MKFLSPRCCVLWGWSLLFAEWVGPVCSGWKWTWPRQLLARSRLRASPPRSSASCTPASPSRSWALGPSKTGTGCWSRCRGPDHAPRRRTSLRISPPPWIKFKKNTQRKGYLQRRRYRYDLLSSTEVTGSVSDVWQRQRCIILALCFSWLSR